MKELGSMSHDGSGCCCEFQCSLPQYATQRILEDHLVSFGSHIERGVTATKVESTNGDVAVELTYGGGKVETVHPRFVIGAGGAHSVTRHSMGNKMSRRPATAFSSRALSVKTAM